MLVICSRRRSTSCCFFSLFFIFIVSVCIVEEVEVEVTCVLNIFIYFDPNIKFGRLLEPLMPSNDKDVFKRNHTTPVTSFWYSPPKKSEVFNVQARQLVYELAKMPDSKPSSCKSYATEDMKDEVSKADEKKTKGSM